MILFRHLQMVHTQAAAGDGVHVLSLIGKEVMQVPQ